MIHRLLISDQSFIYIDQIDHDSFVARGKCVSNNRNSVVNNELNLSINDINTVFENEFSSSHSNINENDDNNINIIVDSKNTTKKMKKKKRKKKHKNRKNGKIPNQLERQYNLIKDGGMKYTEYDLEFDDKTPRVSKHQNTVSCVTYIYYTILLLYNIVTILLYKLIM